MARYRYKLPDGEITTGETPTTNAGLSDTAEKKTQNYLSGHEVYAADYTQTAANINKEREHRGFIKEDGITPDTVVFPHIVPGQTEVKATQLLTLRAATQGLVNYDDSDTFPWSENITAMATKLKARHLEEVRQVIDDALNNARCYGGCSSVCGRGCGSGCFAVCSVTCGGDCDGGCSQACSVGCGNNCGDGCGGSCKGDCGTGCTGDCGGACNTWCGNKCTGGCGNDSCDGYSDNGKRCERSCQGCTGGCNGGCSDGCTSGCKGGCQSCDGGCNGECDATCGNEACENDCHAACQKDCGSDCGVDVCASNCTDACYINCNSNCRNNCYTSCSSGCFKGCSHTSRYGTDPGGTSAINTTIYIGTGQ